MWNVIMLSFYLPVCLFSGECSAATGANVKESCINLVAKIHQNNQTEMTTPVEKQGQQGKRRKGDPRDHSMNYIDK